MERPIAFLFPGQGTVPTAPPPNTPTTTRLLARAEEAGLPLVKWITESDPGLTRTATAQPAILIDSVAKAEKLRAAGITPDFVAGHSLGEYAALVSAEVITADQALDLVIERGRLMERVPGGMAALLKLDNRTVEEICATAGATVANYNGPGQIVISGDNTAVERAMTLAAAAGGRAIRLNVSGPFHSPAMLPAQQELARHIAAITFRDPRVPVVSGMTGQIERSGARLQQLLMDQITACVHWDMVVATLTAARVRTAVEAGPGAVLTRIGRRITDRIKFIPYAEVADGGT